MKNLIDFLFYYKKNYLEAQVVDTNAIIGRLREEYRIVDRMLLWQGSVILGMVILLFMVHSVLKMEPCIAGIIGASANVVTTEIAERMGYLVSFMQIMKATALPSFITIVVCTIRILGVVLL